VRDAARPILARLVSPVQCGEPIRRLFAGLGALAAILALTSVAAPIVMAVLGLAAVMLTGWALYGDDRAALKKFAASNGVAILLLAWGALVRSELRIVRTPEQLDVSLNGVRLSASLAGRGGPLDRVSVELGAVDERPVAAPWTFDALPAHRGFGDWLDGHLHGRAGGGALALLVEWDRVRPALHL
jgi:hypothetical protein